jgi:hypothetical protein
MKDESPRLSTDIAAFHKLIEIDITGNSVQWEAFGTPEYTVGVPGPTDYITLIAEVEPADQSSLDMKEQTGKVWIAPESARPWLSSSFRSMLENNKNTEINLSSKFPCRKIQATLRKTSKPIDGFICIDAGKMLIYLTLDDFTGA